jgi:hypothetical protein
MTFTKYLGDPARENSEKQTVESVPASGDPTVVDYLLIPLVLLYWIVSATLRLCWRYRTVTVGLSLLALVAFYLG